MVHYNIPRNAIIEIDGVPHKYLGEIIPGRPHLMNCITGHPYMIDTPQGSEIMTREAYDVLLLEGRLVVKESQKDRLARRIASETDWDSRDCDALDPKSRKTWVQCTLLDDLGIPNGFKAMSIALTDHWTPELKEKFGEHDNVHTIKRWRSERGEIGNRTHRDMVRMWGKVPRGVYVDDHIMEVRKKAAMRQWVSKVNYADAHAEVVAEILDINEGRSPHYPKPDKPYPYPSYDTVRRDCQQLECAATTGAKNGDAAVEADWRGSGKSLTANRALELAIIDHTPLDGFLVVDLEREMIVGSPTLSVMIDVCTKVILAHVIAYQAPSVWTVAELLKRANLPKRPPPAMAARYPVLRRICGKAAEIIVDNGAEFRSEAFEDAAKSAGFAVRHCPLRKSRYRGLVERTFPTIQGMITEKLRGASLPIAKTRKLGYDAKKFACVTTNQVEAVANWAMAEYHTNKHAGLMERQPALMFEKSVAKYGIDLVHDVKSFFIEILDIIPTVQLSKTGIRQWGLRYHCPRAVPSLLDDLVPREPRRQRRDGATATVKAKYDPQDISVIHVWNRVRKKYVTLKCADETYADGMPLWFHEQIKAAAKAEADAFNTQQERLAARAKRIQAIRNISPAAKHEERKTVARLYEIPRLRQITGNLVHLHTDEAEAVSVEDFISHDLSSTTMLDDEILAPRQPIDPRGRRDATRDPRDAGSRRASAQSAENTTRTRPASRRASGSYN